MDIRRMVSPLLANVLVWLAALIAGLKALIAGSRIFDNHSFSSLLVASTTVFLLFSFAIGVLLRMAASAILLALYFATLLAYRVAEGRGVSSSLDVGGLVLGTAAILAVRLYPRGARST